MTHFKKNALSKTGCGRRNNDPKNIDWNKVDCRECLMTKEHLKNKRR